MYSNNRRDKNNSPIVTLDELKVDLLSDSTSLDFGTLVEPLVYEHRNDDSQMSYEFDQIYEQQRRAVNIRRDLSHMRLTIAEINQIVGQKQKYYKISKTEYLKIDWILEELQSAFDKGVAAITDQQLEDIIRHISKEKTINRRLMMELFYGDGTVLTQHIFERVRSILKADDGGAASSYDPLIDDVLDENLIAGSISPKMDVDNMNIAIPYMNGEDYADTGATESIGNHIDRLLDVHNKYGYVTMDHITAEASNSGLSMLEVDTLYDHLMIQGVKIVDGEFTGDVNDVNRDVNWYKKLTESNVERHTTVVTLTNGGCFGRAAAEAFQTQNRGGRGKTGVFDSTDLIKQVTSTDSHDILLILTSEGKIHNIPVYTIPDLAEVDEMGQDSMIIPLREGERATAFVTVKNYDSGYLVMATKHGIVKRTELSKFVTRRKVGILAIDLYKADELISVIHTNGDDEIMIITEKGRTIRFHENEVRDMGRLASGVRGIELEGDDIVIGMDKCSPKGSLVVISKNGYGKKTQLDNYRTQNRGGKGMSTYNPNGKTGYLASAVIACELDDVVMINSEGTAIRLAVKHFPDTLRQTSGALMMRVKDGFIVGMSCLPGENYNALIE